SPLAGREVEGEEAAPAREGEVVDDETPGERGPAEPAARPRLGDVDGGRGVCDRKGTDLLRAARPRRAVCEPVPGDRELLDAGDRRLQNRLQRVARGDSDGVARVPGDQRVADGRVAPRQ